jgi:ketosteroid isomerase-like protein
MSNEEYHSLIATLVRAMNAHHSDAVVACFTDQAVVRDEGREHRGSPAIKAWITDAFQKYQFKVEVMQVSDGEEEIAFNARVSGTFEGSPIELLHKLSIKNGKIVSLTITPAAES